MTVETGGPQERLHSRDAYLAPTRECDVVMKGGITSGVLYPLAVCELASVYRLRNVGGTSAGAIAAAAAAAAEYGRTSEKPGSGFQGLAALPAWLGTDDHLVGLFRPPAVTRRLHGLLLRAVSPGASPVRLLGAVVWSGLSSGRWWLPVLGALPGALLVVALLAGDSGSWLSWVGALVALALAGGGLVVGAALAVVLNAGAALDANMYGIVSGPAAADGGDSLSDWLADQIDTLAGLEPGGPPLTFGDLWAGPSPGPTPAPGRSSTSRCCRPTSPRAGLTGCRTTSAPPSPSARRSSDGSSHRGWSRTWCSTRQARAPTRGWCRGRRPVTCRWSWRPG